MNTNKLNLIPLSLASLTILAGTILVSSIVSADDSVVDEINITVPLSCTLSGTGMDAHNAEINNGTYNSAIGETTLKAFCNDNEGFAIYAIGYTDNEEGKNVLTNSTLGSTYDITTGTAVTGNDSKWAMKLTKLTSPTPTYPIIIAGSTEDSLKAQGDPDYSTFQEVPDDYTKVAYRTSATDTGTNAEGATLTTTYQAYISPTQSAGTYTGQVKYTMVHPHNAAAPYKKIYMQDLTSTTIAQLLPNTHDTAKVVDKRDEQEYTIAKLADGNYWMVENLNIAGGTALSSEDTDFDASYTLPTTDGWTVTDGKLVLPASAIKNEADNNLTDYIQFGAVQYGFENYAYVFNSNNKEGCDAGQNAPCYSYYSWDAATLGSGRSISTDNTDASYSICPKNWKLPTTSNTSIDNWRTESDFYVFAHQYGFNEYGNTTATFDEAYDSRFYDQAGPGTTPDFLLGGYYMYGSFYNGGTEGEYWSATSNSNSNEAQLFIFSSGYVNSASYRSRIQGSSVRCLLKTN